MPPKLDWKFAWIDALDAVLTHDFVGCLQALGDNCPPARVFPESVIFALHDPSTYLYESTVPVF